MHVDDIFGAIGRFAVRFRWLVVLLWIAGAIAAMSQLPSLSSVTQNSNSQFLPASAPSEHAAQLAAPFGSATLAPVPVVAARSSSLLSPADVTALTSLQGQLRSVSGVSKVLDAGTVPRRARRAAGRARAAERRQPERGGRPSEGAARQDRAGWAAARPPGCTWRATSPPRWTSSRRPATPAASCSTCRWRSSSRCWC